MFFTDRKKKEWYRALVDRDPKYEGAFFYAVETTGTFCRPTCPSRKPRIENCHFFKTQEEASQAKYRPCLRCNPCLLPNGISSLMETILIEIKENPDKQWKESDFSKYGISPITVRRHFQKRFGITFVKYLRMYRLERAFHLITSGKSIIEVQQSLGYESSSGFRDAFYRFFGTAPSKLENTNLLKFSLIDTPLGPMTVIANEKTLYFLDFIEYKDLYNKIEEIKLKTHSIIFPGISHAICHIEKELHQYFNGKLKAFDNSIRLQDSHFQQDLYKVVQKIPFGETRVYSDFSSLKECSPQTLKKVSHTSPFAIIIPFHRLLNNKGKNIFKGNLIRNQWLVNHEQEICRRNLQEKRQRETKET